MATDRQNRPMVDGAMARDIEPAEASTKSTQLEVINLRLEFLSMALAALAGQMPDREAGHAARVIGEKIIEYLGREPVSEDAERAVAEDLAAILSALRQR